MSALLLLSGLPVLLGCAAAAALPAPQAGSASTAGASKPTLVVVLVVDQLRGDMLERYSSVFTAGFRRLMDQGLTFSNALHAHAATETSPGHATISTGVSPARAGIPANAWREEVGGEMRLVFNVEDPQEELVGLPGTTGSSPNVLRRSGLADWIQDADAEAKVLSISAKDRAAILMAGKSRGEVYWFNSQAGRFVTSTYYRDSNPAWLVRFNDSVMTGFRADSVWVSTVPEEVAILSAPDTANFEGDGVRTFFPHSFSQEYSGHGADDFFLWFEGTPMLDRATLEVSLLAIGEEGLGQTEGHTDFLSISFSQTDRVGHAYGPLSREQMDNLLRLDGLLGELLSFLDETVGAQNYVVGFTSDHGILTSPERLEPKGLRLSSAHRAQMEQALSQAVRRADAREDSRSAEAMVEALGELSFVGPAFTHEELLREEPRDTMMALFKNSFVPGRGGGLLSMYGVEMWWAEDVLGWSLPHGTTHGSPFFYDRWVPLILMGPTIENGRVDRPVAPMDLAPTLATIAGIPFPGDLDGKPLLSGGN